MAINWLSKSKILTYLSCPKLFKFYYIMKIETPTNIGMIRGKMLHEYYEDLFNHIRFDGNEIVLPDLPNEKDTIALNMMKNIHNFEKERWNYCVKNNRKDLFMPVFREKIIEVGGLGIRGIIDRVDKNMDDSYSVIELKTGVSPKVWDFSLIFELEYYKLLLEKAKLLDNIRDGVVILPRHNNILVRKLDRKEWCENIIDEVWNDVKNNEFGPTTTSQCINCFFREKCFGRSVSY